MPDALSAVKYPLTGGSDDTSLSVWLFKDVKNSKAIKNQIVTGSIHPELAFINAKLIPDLFIVRAAAQKAFAASLRGALRTRSLHAELVFNIAGSKHVGESLKRFGVSDETQHILVACFHTGHQDMLDGVLSDTAELEHIFDTAAILQSFKIFPMELKVGTITDAIVCRMAASHC